MFKHQPQDSLLKAFCVIRKIEVNNNKGNKFAEYIIKRWITSMGMVVEQHN